MQKVNPFNYINPIKKEEFFIGRKTELKTIDYILDLAESKSQYQNIAITGNRAIGKTSLLNMLLSRASKRHFLTICIDLDEKVVTDSTKFFGEVIRSILFVGATDFGLFGGKEKDGLFAKFTKIIEGAGIEVEIPLLFTKIHLAKPNGKKTSEASDIDLLHDFDYIRKEIQKKNLGGILIALDEANLLSNNRVILQKIRNIFQKLEGYIIVLSGTESLLKDLSSVFSPIQRFFVRLNLAPFSQDEIKDALEIPLRTIRSKIALDPHIIDDVQKMSKGYPYEINLIAHFAFKIAIENKLEALMLTKEVFEEIRNQKSQLVEFEKIFSSLSGGMQDVLKLIVFFDGQLSVTEFARLGHDFEDKSKVTRASVIRKCTNMHRPIFKDLEKKGILIEIRTVRGQKIYGFADRWMENYVKYVKVIPEAFKQYPHKHFHMLKDPSFTIMDKMSKWITRKFDETILLCLVATKRENEGWSCCVEYREKDSAATEISRFVMKRTRKIFGEKRTEVALSHFQKFIHESLPQETRRHNSKILSKMIMDDYDAKVAIIIFKYQGETKVQKAFEEAINYIRRFWTAGRVNIY